MGAANYWVEVKKDWFKEYFGELDKRNKRAPSGSPDSNRSAANEESSLLVADPWNFELHLSHSFGLEQGPIIQRLGDSPPFMEDPEQPGTYVTDADLQRVGSYYIRELSRSAHVLEVYYRFAGSYILLGKIHGASLASNVAKSVLLAYSHGAGDFSPPPPFNPGMFFHNIVDTRQLFENYLRGAGRGDLADVFVRCASGANPDMAGSKMVELYKPITGDLDLITDFVTLRDKHAFQAALAYNTRKYLRLLILALRTPSHEQKAMDRTASELIFMQGCGDLTMNNWNVAFITGDSFEGKDTWCLLHPPGEPLNDRTYSCLIKWSCPKDSPDLMQIAEATRVVYPYQIARLRFKGPSLEPGPANRHVFLDEWPIGHLIEFAVYGKQVVKDGDIVRLQSTVAEYGDIRHVYKLPNLNRDESYDPEATSYGIPEYAKRPRNLFDASTHDDVWLGEAALVQGDRNLKVAGIVQPIQLDLRALGAPKDWIELVLAREESKYNTYSKAKAEPAKPGEWRWIAEGRRTWLEIFLLPNQYPCTMIGVKASDEGRGTPPIEGSVVDCERLFLLAHGHNYSWQGCTVVECAQYLCNKKESWNTLMLDEGNDVFQLVREKPGGELDKGVPLKRNELRCVFWAAAGRGGAG